MLCGISSRFQLLSPTERQVSHALLTRSPLSRKPKLSTPFDLHVLGTPPAFVLSQDQTLKKLYLKLLSKPQISFLNNLLLAIITQEFSLAVNSISRNLNKSINLSKVFSLSLRYSIYKVQTLFVLLTFVRSELLYSITSCRTCQELFSSFFKFFLMFVVLQASAVHHTTFLVYHKQFVLSRTFSCFFEFLLIYFVLFGHP